MFHAVLLYAYTVTTLQTQPGNKLTSDVCLIPSREDPADTHTHTLTHLESKGPDILVASVMGWLLRQEGFGFTAAMTVVRVDRVASMPACASTSHTSTRTSSS
eukprot:559608-Pelagomonas_calceolata.AAC.6